jgi:hypothetical protein
VPDGLFSNQKSQFGKILEGLRKENVGIFYDNLEYFTAIWYNSWPFGIVCGHFEYFPQFRMIRQKTWQTWISPWRSGLVALSLFAELMSREIESRRGIRW